MDAPKHVILFSYDAATKQHERYDALVIGSREFEDHDEPILNLVYFRHNDTASHHALNGVDWADTLERMLDVPHKYDLQQQSFYYLNEGEENPVPAQPADEEVVTLREQLKDAREVLEEYDKVVSKLRAELADTTEGRDKALQAIADAGNKLPSGPSLVTTETRQYSDGSSATGPAPLPEQSPAQQDAADAAKSASD